MAAEGTAQRFEVGQRYRDESGYVWDVVKVEPNGDAWCKHPNTRVGATYTNAGWAETWTLISDREEPTDAH